MTTDPFVHDDAAYVLGALSADERRAFEEHLPTCADCMRRVAELQPVVGQLAGLDEAAFTETAFAEAAEPVPDTLLPALLRTVRAEQRRRHRLVAALTGLAAAAVIALGAVLAWPSPHHTTAPAQAMTAISASPVHATASISSTSWGTKIVVHCHYDGLYPTSTSYSLVVIDKAGGTHDVGSWTLPSEDSITFPSGIALPRDQLKTIEITAGQTPILSLDV